MPPTRAAGDNTKVDTPLPPELTPPPSRFRWAWWLLAWTSLLLGLIGLFLPVMPTTVFILIAAFAASRGSERLHRALLSHRHFGPLIHDWQAYGAIPRRAKWLASWTMLASAAFTVTAMAWLTPAHWWLSAIPVACLSAVVLWMWQRPEPPPAP